MMFFYFLLFDFNVKCRYTVYKDLIKEGDFLEHQKTK